MKSRLTVRFSLIAALLASAAAWASPEVPRLDNGALRIAFEGERGGLVSFEDSHAHHDSLTAEPRAPLWRIEPSRSGYGSALVPQDAAAFNAHLIEGGRQVELVWQGFGKAHAPELRVSVTVTLDERAPMSAWRITVENLPWTPTAIRFPCVGPVAPQEDEVLAVPVWMGERTSRARELLGDNGGRIEWEYPGILSMQCLALYRPNGPGLYVASDDTGTLAKRFAVTGGKDRSLGIEISQLPAEREVALFRYASPYSVLLGTFEGDWFTAAERYRAWALRQPWAEASRLKRGEVEPWAAQTGLWVWNRGRSDGVLGPAAALQERAHVPVSVFWHWWHGCAYDMGFPEYLPPREGADPFRAALEHAHESGIHAIVYMNQRLWGMTTRSWKYENAERFAVKGPDGKVRPEVYNTFTKAPCASMCMGTEFWRNHYAGLAVEAVEGLGVDGIYMDQACSSLACYDPSHGHPLGGGAYWMDGFKALQADIRAKCRPSRNVVLAGEGCGEAWLPYLDLMLSLQVSLERYAQPGAWEPIPFFHAVYHGYAIFYGNYSSLTMPPYDDLWPPEFAPKEPLRLLDRKFAGQFRLEQARALVWGQQPTIANVRASHFEDRPEEMACALGYAAIRNQALKYLLHGTMLRPPEIPVPERTIDISRLSIYAGQQELVNQYTKTCPSVLASAWRAEDGDLVIVLANITATQQVFDVSLDRAIYGLNERSVIRLRDLRGVKTIGNVEGTSVTLHVNLNPAEACLFEIASLRDALG